MPKFKPNKGVLKRMKVTGQGKVKFARSGKSHLNSTTSAKRTRTLRRPRTATAADIGRLETLLGRRLKAGNRK